MSKFDPTKVNPFAGLFGQRAPKPEPPRRMSMRAMKAVDLKNLGPDDVLEVDEFSVATGLDEGGDLDPDEQARREDALSKAKKGQEHAGEQQAQQAKRKDKRQLPNLRPEAFGPPQQKSPLAQAEQARPVQVQKLPPRPVDPKFSALVALDSAQDPGVFYVEDREREGHSEEQEDPALREAVEECIRLLFGVRGIHRVGPGRNEKNEPIIIIAAAEGFSQDSMKAVPERVQGFATLVALPFDIVPLRRTTSSR